MYIDIVKLIRVVIYVNKWIIIWKKYYLNLFDKIIYDENCCSGIWEYLCLFKIELIFFNDWCKILLLEVVVLYFCLKMNCFFSNCVIYF